MKKKTTIAKYLTQKRAKSFAGGGAFSWGDKSPGAGALSAGANMAGSLVNLFDQPNEDGVQSDVGAGLSGAMSGAAAGMALGPVGAIGGAIIGGLSSILGNNAAEDAARKKKEKEGWMRDAKAMQQSKSVLANYDNMGTGLKRLQKGGITSWPGGYRVNPLKFTPTKNTFQQGGVMTPGGELQPIGESDSFEIKGDNPGLTDDVMVGDAALDHNEVAKPMQDGMRIFSDTLMDPLTGLKFSKAAKNLEKQKTKDTGKFPMQNVKVEAKLDALFQRQQMINGDSQGESVEEGMVPQGEQMGEGFNQGNMFKQGGRLQSIYQHRPHQQAGISFQPKGNYAKTYHSITPSSFGKFAPIGFGSAVMAGARANLGSSTVNRDLVGLNREGLVYHPTTNPKMYQSFEKGGKLHLLAESENELRESQLEMGIPIEAEEHHRSLTEGKTIAGQHLKEDKKYYTKLKKAGLQLGGTVPTSGPDSPGWNKRAGLIEGWDLAGVQQTEQGPLKTFTRGNAGLFKNPNALPQGVVTDYGSLDRAAADNINNAGMKNVRKLFSNPNVQSVSAGEIDWRKSRGLANNGQADVDQGATISEAYQQQRLFPNSPELVPSPIKQREVNIGLPDPVIIDPGMAQTPKTHPSIKHKSQPVYKRTNPYAIYPGRKQPQDRQRFQIGGEKKYDENGNLIESIQDAMNRTDNGNTRQTFRNVSQPIGSTNNQPEFTTENWGTNESGNYFNAKVYGNAKPIAGLDVTDPTVALKARIGKEPVRKPKSNSVSNSKINWEQALTTGATLIPTLANAIAARNTPASPDVYLNQPVNLQRISGADQINSAQQGLRTASLAAQQNTVNPNAQQAGMGNAQAQFVNQTNAIHGSVDRQNTNIGNQQAMINSQIMGANNQLLGQKSMMEQSRLANMQGLQSQTRSDLATKVLGLTGQENLKQKDAREYQMYMDWLTANGLDPTAPNRQLYMSIKGNQASTEAAQNAQPKSAWMGGKIKTNRKLVRR